MRVRIPSRASPRRRIRRRSSLVGELTGETAAEPTTPSLSGDPPLLREVGLEPLGDAGGRAPRVPLHVRGGRLGAPAAPRPRGGRGSPPPPRRPSSPPFRACSRSWRW